MKGHSMSDFIISCDPGNGGTNAVLARDSGRHKSVYFPISPCRGHRGQPRPGEGDGTGLRLRGLVRPQICRGR